MASPKKVEGVTRRLCAMPQHGPSELFGCIDIYIFDQILRGRIQPGQRVFDAGCGGGRNLTYFLRTNHPVRGVDSDAQAIESVRALAESLSPAAVRDDFQVAGLEDHPFPDASADVVLCNAVLHFARDDRQFRAMLEGAWRVLDRAGLFFARLASSIGIEDRIEPIQGRRHRLPDGTERYLVDEALLLELTQELGGELLDPIKTTNVQNLRCMTTWVMRKH